AENEDGVDVRKTRTAARRLPVGHRRMLRHDARISADVGVVHTGLVAETLDHRERMRHRIVLRDAVACVGPREDGLARTWRGTASSAAAAAASWRLLNRPGRRPCY